MIRIKCGAEIHAPRAGECVVKWARRAAIPTVLASWRAAGLKIEERLFCPVWSAAMLCREVKIKNTRHARVVVELVTGVRDTTIRRRAALQSGETKTLTVGYTMNAAADTVSCEFLRRMPRDEEARTFWRSLARISFSDPLLDDCFRTSTFQLPVGVSRAGCVDGSIWQYNLEWLRDQSMVALALTMIGAVGPATTMFTRLLDKFVTPEGDTLDSSTVRNPADVELDQNGILLCTLRDYVLWTGNLGLVRAKWAKVVAVAEFPLREIFRHSESGLLVNCREFWERHKVHGIRPGMEMIYQFYVSQGLAAAAVLARMTGHAAEALRWDAESAGLKTAMLEDKRFRMHDARGFIKRRAPDGSVQETIVAAAEASLPASVPLGGAGPHYLNPDTSAALPIAFEMIPPNSPLARRTFKSLERLWNQNWKTGGYGRYHVTSEPDSPGGWPFASLFVARAAVEAGDHGKVWRVLRWLGEVPGAKSGAWFEFYGRRLAPPFPQVGIVVWNWAELIVLYVQHILGVQPQEHGLRVRPRLLSGVHGARATFMLRGERLALNIKRVAGGKKPVFRTRAKVLKALPGEVLVAYEHRPLTINASV